MAWRKSGRVDVRAEGWKWKVGFALWGWKLMISSSCCCSFACSFGGFWGVAVDFWRDGISVEFGVRLAEGIGDWDSDWD